ncbi:MAG: hypothetical protein K0S07_1032 [Chlamydiales bacterium]|jgi:glycerol-3-phosphate dehydrogenase (NAD(P)+)|nr:hypothetical protein [Chlamydiales bacterium]
MKIGYLGAGTWGFCLSSLLAANGHQVRTWTKQKDLATLLNEKREHPKLPGRICQGDLQFTSDMAECLDGIDLLIESVTSGGIRPVFEQVATYSIDCPICITSKGIEQGSGLILPEVVLSILPKNHSIAVLSGPSHAEEVSRGLPTSVVASGLDSEGIRSVMEAFTSPTFRVYPNSDLRGVCMGGALKNVIAIAAGISDGLGFGFGAKAALVTRGLHEIRKLAVLKGCRPESFYGLAGLGDLVLTSFSPFSRNYRFGLLIAEGKSAEQAKAEIGMAIEGAYTCISAMQIAKKAGVPMPITEAIYAMLQGEMAPQEAVSRLMQRTIKEEHL